MLMFPSPALSTISKLKFFFKILFFREGKGEREGEKHRCVASHVPPIGDMAHNPGMCLGLRIKLATLWYSGQHLNHRATPARPKYFFQKEVNFDRETWKGRFQRDVSGQIGFVITFKMLPVLALLLMVFFEVKTKSCHLLISYIVGLDNLCEEPIQNSSLNFLASKQ